MKLSKDMIKFTSLYGWPTLYLKILKILINPQSRYLYQKVENENFKV